MLLLMFKKKTYEQEVQTWLDLLYSYFVLLKKDYLIIFDFD